MFTKRFGILLSIAVILAIAVVVKYERNRSVYADFDFVGEHNGWILANYSETPISPPGSVLDSIARGRRPLLGVLFSNARADKVYFPEYATIDRHSVPLLVDALTRLDCEVVMHPSAFTPDARNILSAQLGNQLSIETDPH